MVWSGVDNRLVFGYFWRRQSPKRLKPDKFCLRRLFLPPPSGNSFPTSWFPKVVALACNSIQTSINQIQTKIWKTLTMSKAYWKICPMKKNQPFDSRFDVDADLNSDLHCGNLMEMASWFWPLSLDPPAFLRLLPTSAPELINFSAFGWRALPPPSFRTLFLKTFFRPPLVKEPKRGNNLLKKPQMVRSWSAEAHCLAS